MSAATMYDPIDTAYWMLDGVRSQVLDETVLTATGKPKKKTKAEREAERLRYLTLCEFLWNVEGRPEPLDAFSDRMLVAA